MSDFYRSEPAVQGEAYAALARAALAHWSMEDAELQLLKMRENAVFSVSTGTGQRYAMRIHRAGYHSDDALLSELQWMTALDAEGIHTPRIIPSAAGELFERVRVDEVPESRQVDMLAWIDGRPLGSLEAGVVGELHELVENYRLLGNIAARLHNQGENWQLPAGFTRHAWDLEGLVGEQPFWGRFWENESLDDGQRELVLKGRELVRAGLQDFGQGPDRYGLIHADFLPENLMVSGDDIKLIDFDDSGYGWYLFELATSLFVHLGQDHFDEVCAALVEGYRSQRALPDEHLDYLPVFLLARALTYLGWMHTREATDTISELAPLIITAATELAEQLLAAHE